MGPCKRRHDEKRRREPRRDDDASALNDGRFRNAIGDFCGRRLEQRRVGLDDIRRTLRRGYVGDRNRALRRAVYQNRYRDAAGFRPHDLQRVFQGNRVF